MFIADVPALGWRVYSRSGDGSGAAPALPGMLEAGENWFENAAFRLEVDRQTGEITSLYDKRNSVEMFCVPACFGSDTWSHGVDAYRDEIGRFGGASVTLEETGPVRASLCIETGWGSSKSIHRVYLYRDIEFVECRLTIDWREQYRALKLSLPVSLEAPEAACETPYGCAACPVDGTEQPGQQWAGQRARLMAGIRVERRGVVEGTEVSGLQWFLHDPEGLASSPSALREPSLRFGDSRRLQVSRPRWTGEIWGMWSGKAEAVSCTPLYSRFATVA